MVSTCAESWVFAVFLGISTCFLIFLYAQLRIRYNRTCLELKNISESLSAKTKELEEFKKNSSDITDSFSTENARSIIITIDKKGIITYINDYAEEFFGFNKKDLLHHSIIDTIMPPSTHKDANQPTLVEKILLNPQLYVDIETKNVRQNGDTVWVSWTNRVVYDEDNNPIEIRSVGFDITKRKQLEEKLKQLTSMDPLTGVLNRAAFLEIGNKEIKRAIRYDRKVSLLVLKLDHFRMLGQEFGYSFGDEALQKTVHICKDSIRDSDYLGRIGDVEFAILLPETPIENVQFLAERLRLKIQEQNLKTEIGNAFITTAFGIAGRVDEKDSIDAMLVRANQSLKENMQKSK